MVACVIMYCYIAANDKTVTAVYQYLMLNAKNLGGDGQKCKGVVGGQRTSAVRVDADGSLYSALQFTCGPKTIAVPTGRCGPSPLISVVQFGCRERSNDNSTMMPMKPPAQ